MRGSQATAAENSGYYRATLTLMRSLPLWKAVSSGLRKKSGGEFWRILPAPPAHPPGSKAAMFAAVAASSFTVNPAKSSSPRRPNK